MFKKINIVIKLVAINVAIFLLLNIIDVFIHLSGGSPKAIDVVLSFVSVPATTKELFFRFWTPFTYMFVQKDFWHILGNMLWLYFLGIILIRFIKEKDFLALYIIGGLAGALIYIVSFNVFPVFSDLKIYSILLGASASVTAIVVALGTLKPNEEVYFFGLFRIKLFIIAAGMVIYDIFLLKGDNAGGHFAHLGGAIYGFIYGFQLRKGRNISSSFADFLENIFFKGSNKSFFSDRKKNNMKVIKNNLKTKDDYEYNKKVNEINKEIDRILDKISKKGYKNLTKKEKNFLKKHGKNYR